MVTLFLGLIAGTLTTLSPCALPILPIVLAGALGRHRWGAVALIGGLVLSFTAIGLAVSGAAWSLNIPSDLIRTASAALLLLFGLVLLSTALQKRFAGLSAPLSNALSNVAGRFAPEGVRGQFLLGALLGAIWTPCSGPTLGAAITLATSGGSPLRAGAVMTAFGIGAGAPLLALSYGSRESLKARRAALAGIGRSARPVLGAVLAAIAFAILLGFDRRVEAALVDAMPDWLLGLTTRF